MKRLAPVLAIALAACAGGPAAPIDQGGVEEGPGVDGGADLPDGASPTDMADGVTTLRVHYPAGTHTLRVRGDTGPLSWQAGAVMSDLADDTHEYVLTLPPSVAQVEWKPLLDDATWSRGPNYVARRGEIVDVYPHFVAQKGSVSKLFVSFHSALLGNDRPVWVYLPVSYGENPRATYPVLYMHDGQNLFDPQGPWGGWRVDEALDAAGESGAIRELIVVGPENTAGRDYEYTPTYDAAEGSSGGGDLYLRMLVEELKPQVDAMLRTQPGRATTGVMGSSLGGLISAYAGYKQPGTFGLVGALSPSTWWDNEVIVADVKAQGAARPDRVYVDCGDGDDGLAETDHLFSAYQTIGYTEGTTLKTVVQPGGQHQENYWAMRVPGAMAFLFGKRAP